MPTSFDDRHVDGMGAGVEKGREAWSCSRKQNRATRKLQQPYEYRLYVSGMGVGDISCVMGSETSGWIMQVICLLGIVREVV